MLPPMLTGETANVVFSGIVALSDRARTASRIGNDLVRDVIDDNWTLEIGYFW